LPVEPPDVLPLPSSRPTLSLVLPVYDEEAVLPELHARVQALLATLRIDAEVIFVDDGSRDRTVGVFRELAAREPRYRVLSFARNFGHQAAITPAERRS
jgi:dolichol-phosphate mannosyltransferase